jgi:hypothetical protein
MAALGQKRPNEAIDVDSVHASNRIFSLSS